jgi:hypothetical protein
MTLIVPVGTCRVSRREARSGVGLASLGGVSIDYDRGNEDLGSEDLERDPPTLAGLSGWLAEGSLESQDAGRNGSRAPTFAFASLGSTYGVDGKHTEVLGAMPCRNQLIHP